MRRSKDVVLRAATDLLIAAGMSGVTIDEVARRSGVAKTTIYRHWQSRSDLVLDACAMLSTAQATPHAGSFERDVTALLLDLAHLLKTAQWPTVLPSIIDAGERDAGLASIYAGIQASHVAPYLEVIARGKRKREVRASADANAIVAELVGPLFYRRWFSREPLDETFVRGVVKMVAGNWLPRSQ